MDESLELNAGMKTGDGRARMVKRTVIRTVRDVVR